MPCFSARWPAACQHSIQPVNTAHRHSDCRRCCAHICHIDTKGWELREARRATSNLTLLRPEAILTASKPRLSQCRLSQLEASLKAFQHYFQHSILPHTSIRSTYRGGCCDHLQARAGMSDALTVVYNERPLTVTGCKRCDAAKHHLLHHALAMMQKNHCTCFKLISFGADLLTKIKI